jgi:ankyrin repeat protein
MYVASMNGDVEILKLLYKSNADINAESQRRQPYLFESVDCYKNHALNAAAFEDHEPIVNFLIDHGADINHESGYCGSPLSSAAAAGNGSMVRLLIEKGAKINKTALSRSSGPKTALEAACWGGHEDVVRLLIAEGANVKSGEKRTYCSALRWTMKIRSKTGARSSIARILLENGAKVDFMGSTICSFIRSGDVEIVNLLLDCCSDVDEKSADGRTPMEIACEVGDEETVRTLLDRGADTAIGCCIASVAGGPDSSEDVRMRILHLVVAAGADVNARGQGTYCGALHGACQQAREKIFTCCWIWEPKSVHQGTKRDFDPCRCQ